MRRAERSQAAQTGVIRKVLLLTMVLYLQGLGLLSCCSLCHVTARTAKPECLAPKAGDTFKKNIEKRAPIETTINVEV